MKGKSGFVLGFLIISFSLWANYVPFNSLIYSYEEMTNIKTNDSFSYPISLSGSHIFNDNFYIMLYDSSNTDNYYDIEVTAGAEISLNDYWKTFTTVIVLQNNEYKPYYQATEWRAGLAALFAEAGIEGKGNWWKLLVGKKSVKIGFSPYTGLLLSGLMQMEGIHLEFFKGPFKLYAGTYLLPPYLVREDSVETYTRNFLHRGDILNRYISLHGLEVTYKKLTLGFTESVLYSGEGRLPDYFNPLQLYYGEQYDFATTHNDNIFWDFYGNLRMDKQRVYWEIFIDDIQYERSTYKDYEPQQFGIIAGFSGYIKDIYALLEVSFLTPWVYNQHFDWNRYVIDSISPGSQYGPDHLHIFLNLMKENKKGFFYTFNTEILSKGENGYDDEWIFPDTIYTDLNDIFLSGDETTEYEILAGLLYKTSYGMLSLKGGIDENYSPVIKAEFFLLKGVTLFDE